MENRQPSFFGDARAGRGQVIFWQLSMALGALRPGLVYCPGDRVLQLTFMNDLHFSQQRLLGGPATQPPDGQRGPIGSMCELAKGIVTVARTAPSSQSGFLFR